MPAIDEQEEVVMEQAQQNKSGWKKPGKKSPFDKYRKPLYGYIAAAGIYVIGLVILFLLGGIFGTQVVYLVFPPWMAIGISVAASYSIGYCTRTSDWKFGILGSAIGLLTVLPCILFSKVGMLSLQYGQPFFSILHQSSIVDYFSYIIGFTKILFAKRPLVMVLYAGAIYAGYWFAFSHAPKKVA